MSQISCLDCYRKHVATAMVFEDEERIGNAYPHNKWLAIGELNAAAKEVCTVYPILAQITREYCLDYQSNNIPVPTIELISLATQLSQADEKESKKSEELSDMQEEEEINNSREGNKSIDAIDVG